MRTVLFLAMFILISSMAFADVTDFKVKIVPSASDLGDEAFNIVGTWDSPVDHDVLRTEIEACGYYFTFTYPKYEFKKNNEALQDRIWKVLKDKCNWDQPGED
jgi:hypothetical protein